ncbi:hypothetical protein JLK41_24765 [Ectopseudomonas khazarica]|uniref:hypothetical protein n=1 Tax=Ectopseudomonas khazarica TaxID=2502979 RepID=UPI001AEF83F4|nr:hypothetical protein [Pseudomonas khazarica]QTS86474.1 hypothetical protein JLK41_24765 [Pseudomonas khazarica]
MLQNDDDSRLTPGLSLLIMKITTSKDRNPEKLSKEIVKFFLPALSERLDAPQ